MVNMLKKNKNNSIILENKKIHYLYYVLTTYEAGLVLLGSEVKSLRLKHANFINAYVKIKDFNIFLVGLYIKLYKYNTHDNLDVCRMRLLLLHKNEIIKLHKSINESSLLLMPIKIYVKYNKIKLLLGLVKSKHKFDKRYLIKSKEQNIIIRKILRTYS